MDWGHSVPLIRRQNRRMLLAMLSFEHLQIAVAAASQRFDLLQTKYPVLKAKLLNGQPVSYLVLSLPGGQTGINSSPAQILREFPAMVVDDDVKTSILNLMSRLKKLESDDAAGPETARVKEQLGQAVRQLKFHEECQVEIRFHDLKFDLVWKLQKDDLIDHDLTPQTTASIRIVLGTLAQFGRMHHDH
jgi:uncharacterized protein YkuJ